MRIERQGALFVFSGPSGVGKTTVADYFRQTDPEITVSISVTTRPPRSGEVDGQHYFFVTPTEFEEKVREGELLEYATLFNRYSYGTPRAFVEQSLLKGKDIIFDIDWQGRRQIKEKFPEASVSVFFLPPSYQALSSRLDSRRDARRGEIRHRIAAAAEDVQRIGEYDYIVVNASFEDCVRETEAILLAERLKRKRLIGLEHILNAL